MAYVPSWESKLLRSNRRMKVLLKRLVGNNRCARELEELLELGFVKTHGCFLFKALYRNHYASYLKQGTLDEVGLEAFVNSIRASDFTTEIDVRMLLTFAKQTLESFDTRFPGRSLNAALSVADGDAVLKFYVTRTGQSYLAEELEDFDCEAIMEFDKLGLNSLGNLLA